MEPRMKSPALLLPAALEGLMMIAKSIDDAGLSRTIRELVCLRASQINGCSVCVDMHWRALKKLGESDERIFGVGAWREAPYYSDAERAALALAEAATRLADRDDPVPDEVWNVAKRLYEEKVLAALVLTIAQINLFNRVNAATRQVSGPWVEQYI